MRPLTCCGLLGILGAVAGIAASVHAFPPGAMSPTPPKQTRKALAHSPQRRPCHAPPVILSAPSPTREAQVVVTGLGTCPGNRIFIEGGAKQVKAIVGASNAPGWGGADQSRTFQAVVPLRLDTTNHLFFTEFGLDGQSAPSAIEVIQDLSPPTFTIDFPPDGAELTTAGVDVAGQVGDVLSGFMGLMVTVNGLAAEVDIGIGTNGSYFLEAAPLNPGVENVIEVVAADAVGNQVARQITVEQVPIAADAPRMIALSGNAQTAPIDTVLGQPIVVQMTHHDGTPFANKIVTFQITRSNGQLNATGVGSGRSSLQVFTDASGLAQTYWRMGTAAGCGNNRLNVTSTSIAGSTFFCATASPAPAVQINVGSGNNQKAQVNAPVPLPLRAWVSDTCNGIANIPVTFTVVAGGGRVDGQTMVTKGSSMTGHAQAQLTLGPNPGTNVVEANFAGNPGLPATFVATGMSNSNPTTSFTGVVLNNVGQTIQGAVCTLEFEDETLGPVFSDLDGRFAFDNVTLSGPAHLHVDGAKANRVGGLTGTEVPEGSYPALAYPVLVVPNAENSLPIPVLLPPLNPDNVRQYDGTKDVELTIQDIKGLKMIVKKDTVVTLSDGTVAGPGHPVDLALNTVHHDDVPMPMPDGAAPPFAWTLQPAGATFNPPVQIEYPNMSGLPVGAISYFLSFNHGTNRFEIVASGSVAEDGSCIVSDPGTGISVAGWGCNCPPYSVTGDCEGDPDDEDCTCDPNACQTCVDGSCISTCDDCSDCHFGGACIDICDCDDPCSPSCDSIEEKCAAGCSEVNPACCDDPCSAACDEPRAKCEGNCAGIDQDCCDDPCGAACDDQSFKCDAGCEGMDPGCCDDPCGASCSDNDAKCDANCPGLDQDCCQDPCGKDCSSPSFKCNAGCKDVQQECCDDPCGAGCMNPQAKCEGQCETFDQDCCTDPCGAACDSTSAKCEAGCPGVDMDCCNDPCGVDCEDATAKCEAGCNGADPLCCFVMCDPTCNETCMGGMCVGDCDPANCEECDNGSCVSQCDEFCEKCEMGECVLTEAGAVLMARGACVGGACCDFQNHTCQNKTQDSCDDLYKGDGTSCADFAITIDTQPVDAAGCVGGSATFTIAVTGPDPEFRWLVNDSPVIDGDMSTLTLNSLIAFQDGDAVKCVVSNDCFSVTSNEVVLRVFEVSIEDLTRLNECDGVSPGVERMVQVDILPSMMGSGFDLQLDIINGSAANGTATITAGATLTDSGTATVRGGTQTAVGSGANLALRGRINGAGPACAQTAPFAVCAHPTSFMQTVGMDAGSGIIHFEYTWDSDSGMLSDLDQILIGEHVDYPNAGAPPNPPFQWSPFSDPTVINLPATGGIFQDNHSNNAAGECMLEGPDATFVGEQHYRYRCMRCEPPGSSSNANDLNFGVILDGPIDITRVIDESGGCSGGGAGFFYQINKSGVCAERGPLPICGP